MEELLDPDLLDAEEPFEVDDATRRQFNLPHLGIDRVLDIWASGPLFYPAKPPAHWLMCAEVGGRVLIVPIARSREGNFRRCRPIGCYEASKSLAAQYRRDL